PRPDCSHRIWRGGLSPIRTSQGDFIPITAANLLTKSSSGATMSDQDTFRERYRSKVIGFMVAEASAIGVRFLVGAFAVVSWPTTTMLGCVGPAEALTS